VSSLEACVLSRVSRAVVVVRGVRLGLRACRVLSLPLIRVVWRGARIAWRGRLGSAPDELLRLTMLRNGDQVRPHVRVCVPAVGDGCTG
jgi:hypothetical protein